VHDQIAAAERHAAEQRAETDRLYGELVVVMRELGRARRRQFCLQSPLACVAERLRRLVPGRRHG
jgi:hypothetical protein